LVCGEFFIPFIKAKYKFFYFLLSKPDSSEIRYILSSYRRCYEKKIHFHFGYFYYIPGTLDEIKYILVEPNNSVRIRSNDQELHIQDARNLINQRIYYAHDLSVAIIVPTFPAFSSTDHQRLLRDCLLNNIGI